jgi:hypothetical protein
MEIATFVVVDASSIGRFFVLSISLLRLSLNKSMLWSFPASFEGNFCNEFDQLGIESGEVPPSRGCYL